MGITDMLDHGKLPDDLVDKYVRHQLTADEIAEFEIRMLDDPQLFAAVQRAELMQQSFKAQAQAQAAAEPSHDHNFRYLPFRQWIRQPMSLAASVMLGIGVLLLANLSTQQSGTDGLQRGYGVNSVVSIGQTRSATGETVLPSGTHLLQVDVGISLSDASYMLSLSNDENTQSHQFQVTADGNGMVRMLTPANLQGRYQLQVQQQGSTDVLASYSLRFE
jgi:hypothetical protein